MHQFIKSTAAALCIFSLASCATIVSKSSYPVSVKSNPSGLTYTITDRDGQVVANGKTPSSVTLPGKAGYFRGQDYKVEIKKEGKVIGATNLYASINGWFWGNIVFGGAIGMFIVDPLTGAMWKLPAEVTVSQGDQLAATNVQGAATMVSAPQLKIVTIDSLSEEQKAKLIRIN